MSPHTPRPYPDCRELADGFVLSSPAKVNLQLQVKGKREDGYHELDTIFQELDWADDLEFRPAGAFEFSVEGADLPTDRSNLVTRAAEALAERAEVACNAAILLRKRLPLQGGVGGGSSNAAIALLGLNRLWGLNWGVARLLPIAQALGADCPFFLHGGLARGTGRGDIIEPYSGAIRSRFVLLTPAFGVKTAEVFSNFPSRLTEVERNVIFRPLWTEDESGVHPQIFPCNDLENIVFRTFLELQELRDRLIRAGARVALLSGSGSTVFGIFDSDEAARHAAHGLSTTDRVQVTVCRAVARTRE